MRATLEFSDRYGLLGLVVRLWTGSWASHVDFIAEDGQRFGAGPDGGVRLRPWTRPRRAERYTVELPDIDSAMRFAQMQAGKRFNWLGLLGYALHRSALRGRGWFCSELVDAVCMVGGVLLVPDRPMTFVAPKHLLQSPLLTRIS